METLHSSSLESFESAPKTVRTDSPSALPRTPQLNKPRHTKYWLRCLKTHLPTAYQSNDSQRLSLAFFTLSALDLLDELYNNTTESERRDYVNWIYRCQHPQGGFRGFAVSDEEENQATHGNEVNSDKGACWDSANLGSTLFALQSLIILGDNLDRVRRQDCLVWLRSLQMDDGSFGEAKGKGGQIEGGGDVRFCYLAAGVRHLLSIRPNVPLKRAEKPDLEDVNVDALEAYIERSTTYEGAIAKAPLHEAHAGETFCGIGALSLLGRLPVSRSTSNAHHVNFKSGQESAAFIERVTRWLVFRQTTYLEESDDGFDVMEDADVEAEGLETQNSSISPGFQVNAAYPANAIENESSTGILEYSIEELASAGFNGRCNKVADTCYSWWIGGSLAILGRTHLQNFNASERYLLGKTQHLIGGFSKLPGDPPDILHSYLGLATLAMMRYPGLQSIDPVLCISLSAKEGFLQNF